MKEIDEIAQNIIGAKSSEEEQKYLSELSNALSRQSGSTISVEATLSDGSTVDYGAVSDIEKVSDVSIHINVNETRQTIGPWKPQDPENIFNLFLE